eukprot:6198817-Pleurochrysis_carterae.AAC.2
MAAHRKARVSPPPPAAAAPPAAGPGPFSAAAAVRVAAEDAAPAAAAAAADAPAAAPAFLPALRLCVEARRRRRAQLRARQAQTQTHDARANHPLLRRRRATQPPCAQVLQEERHPPFQLCRSSPSTVSLAEPPGPHAAAASTASPPPEVIPAGVFEALCSPATATVSLSTLLFASPCVAAGTKQHDSSKPKTAPRSKDSPAAPRAACVLWLSSGNHDANEGGDRP